MGDDDKQPNDDIQLKAIGTRTRPHAPTPAGALLASEEATFATWNCDA